MRSLMSAGGELQVDAGVALDLAGAVEVADAGVEEDDLRDGQLVGGLELAALFGTSSPGG